MAEFVAANKDEARKEEILRLKGFNVVGSKENPPSNCSTLTKSWRLTFKHPEKSHL